MSKQIPATTTLVKWAAAGALALIAPLAAAQTKEVTIAHQDMLDPYRIVMESGELEKATGYKINWRMFGGGGDVIRAMASGDVQIGEVGSAGVTAAASQGQDIKLFWILDDIADAEALVARNGSGINSVKDLKGKKVATPFVSTSHYQLMADMKSEGVDPKGVTVMNMRPPEIAAAWERGDIDAAFIWDPVLSKVKSNGKVIATSGSIGKKGYPTFDGMVVSSEWAAKNNGFMVALVKALAKADAAYRANSAKWTADSPEVKAVAKWTKADAKGVPEAMKLYKFPTLEEQASPAWLGGGAAKAMTNTAVFLKEQGRVQEIKPDYSAFVTSQYVKEAMAK
ncbi:MAG TPA: taurine ABC transporter substrate-binding protein [Caldimonas sp.]|jgi:taurine transport system substrate-binding protein|nr:taurine ABC transporter substrate-binding protein [Caldimonas sp.]HEV7578043.1 taurine ABC transporter substrate-binding protein [Caldimonas sp.]